MEKIRDWNINQQWTLFLDRDGVINKRNFDGYIKTPAEFEFLDLVPEALNLLQKHFCKIIIITNQQGIAKGLMSLCNVNDIHRYMKDRLKQYDVQIDGVFVAENFRGAENDRRKPDPAMAYEAKKIFPEIDFKKSVMVGDTASDIKFGMNLGMKTVLVKSAEEVNISPDLEVNSLYEFAVELSK